MSNAKKCIPIFDWSQIDSLKVGNSQQRLVINAIEALGFKQSLASYHPQLIGDYALGLEATDSTIKIIMSGYDLGEFEKFFKEKFWNRPGLKIEKKPINGSMSVLVSFSYNQFQVRLSIQTTPIETQRAFKVFRGQLKLLAFVGGPAIDFVEKSRTKGLKTEWAICEFFNLIGDPKLALEKVDSYSQAEMKQFLLNWKNQSQKPVEPEELTITKLVPKPDSKDFSIEMERPRDFFANKIKK